LAVFIDLLLCLGKFSLGFNGIRDAIGLFFHDFGL
jgi:hypothetical protein